VGSDDCQRCHPEQYASWHRSYHRTMTQSVAGAELLAPFAGESLDYKGFRATMSGSDVGRPHVRIESIADGEAIIDADVTYSIGSHRYQQYAATMDRGGGTGEVWRLPVAWHRTEGRWIHMNGAFVEPEGVAGDPEDYLRHLSRWNDNCIFCHNTEPVPGRTQTGAFESRLGEVGIACEACHGPASLHRERHLNPLRRMLSNGNDHSVAQPGKLPAKEESGVCGRCHGQRIGQDVSAILRDGDGFLPGTDLAEVSRPIFRDSKLAGQSELTFEARFWPDGTPRLSAYEYQGLLLSPCYDDGRGLGCNHCHDMHGEEPSMQLRAGKTRAQTCLDCHDAPGLGGAAAVGGHGGHGEVAPDIDCFDCHLPEINYGLLEGMITHRIDNPDPGRWVGRNDQPDACTQCHVDRSRSWAAHNMEALGLKGTVAGAQLPEEQVASRVALDLHGGDALQRNLAAHALAQPKASGEVDVRMGWLAAALEDEYPSVRWFAWRGLRQLAREQGDSELVEMLAHFDYLAGAELRVPRVAELREGLKPGAVDHDPQLKERLEDRRQTKTIWIGE
jgi:hypothetical protein